MLLSVGACGNSSGVLQVARNETLAVELLNLVNAKATLMRQLLILTNGDPKIGNPDAEIDRIKAIVTKYSSGRVKVKHLIVHMHC